MENKKMQPKEVIKLLEILTTEEFPKPLDVICESELLLFKLSYHARQYWEVRGELGLDSISSVLGFVSCCLDGLKLLSETLSDNDDCPISIQQQQVFSKVIQLVIGFGISPCLDIGICTTLLDKKVPCTAECPLERNLYLQNILINLLPFLNNSFYSSLITKHLNVLLSLCVQVIYGPNNPKRVAAQNHSPELIEKAAKIDLILFNKCLSDLLYKTYPPVIVKELLGLQIPKAGVRAPRWLAALSGDLLSDQVMRPHGLRNVSRGLFEQFETVNNPQAYEDQILCDKISDVLMKIPKRNPDTYIESLAYQTYNLLKCTNKVLRIQYLRLFKSLVHKLSDKHPEITFKLIWMNIFKPFVIWKEDQDSEEPTVLFAEEDLEECLSVLETLSEFGMFQGHIAHMISSHFLLTLLNFYHHIYGGISHLKSKTAVILKDIIKEAPVWLKSVECFIESDLSVERNVCFVNGPSGGVMLENSNTEGEVNDNVVEVVVQLLECVKGSTELCDFFLRIFKDITIQSEVQEHDTFLDVDDEFTRFQIKLRKIILVENLCQKMGQDLLKNTSQTIELLKTIIIQKSDGVSQDGDELLLVCFGIIGTYLRDEIKLSEADELEIKSLINPLTIISENANDEMVMSTANDLRICIATRINIDSSNLKTLKKATAVEEFSYEQVLKDLSDPMLPARAHAIMQLGKKFKERHPAAISNISLLKVIIIEHLTHTDSYIFLAAIKCLQGMSWCNTEEVIDVLVREALNKKRKADDRAKVGEALVGVFKIANEMLPAHETTIFQCLLSAASHQSEEVVRVSSLSCLAELCFLCKYGTLAHVQEVLYLAELTLLEDESPLAQKAALLVISKLVQGQGKEIFYQLKDELLQLYRLLKKIAAINPDQDIRLHANLALGMLADIVEEFIFPKPSYKHEIKIL